MTEKETPFEMEFQNRLGNIGALEDKLYDEAETRLLKLSKGNTDVVGASVVLEYEDTGAETPSTCRARVVAYTRPENINGTELADNPMGALKGALNAVERQVREKRNKLRERWKQPGKGESIGDVMEDPLEDSMDNSVTGDFLDE